jgi:hypothetical protein
VVLRLGRSLNQLGHHVGRCWQIGIAHAKINNILAPATSLHLHAIYDAENVGRESFDPLEFHEPERLSKTTIFFLEL